MPMVQLILDDVSFGFSALLQRGHVYRVKLELATSVSNRVLGGTGIASFFPAGLGGPVMPNPFDPTPSAVTKGAENTWLSLLGDMAGSIPNLSITKGDAVAKFTEVGVGPAPASVLPTTMIVVFTPTAMLVHTINTSPVVRLTCHWNVAGWVVPYS